MQFSLQSRIQLLRPKAPKMLYLKRDDELSFGVSGSKVRKFCSLLPFFERARIQHVVMIGGANSNNIAGGIQLLLERGLTPHLVLRKPRDAALHMNEALIRYFVPRDRIHFIERSSWKEASSIAHLLAANLPNSFLLPEGSCCIEALEGAKSLAADICRNEKEERLMFSDIVVDAGTGMQALGMIEGFQSLKRQVRVHVVEIAVKQEAFKELGRKFGISLKLPIFFQRPVTAPSFGSVNKRIMGFMQQFAREQGVLLDPIYSAKTVATAFALAEEKAFRGNTLLIHSGGGISALDLLYK